MAVREVDPRTVLAAFVEKHGGYQAAADKLGYSKPFVWRLANGEKPFPDSVLGKLGLRRPIVAEK